MHYSKNLVERTVQFAGRGRQDWEPFFQGCLSQVPIVFVVTRRLGGGVQAEVRIDGPVGRRQLSFVYPLGS